MAHAMGGGIDCGDGSPAVEGCLFLDNTAGMGGGACAIGTAEIKDCIFVGNEVDHVEYGGYGGGLAICDGGPAVATNCIFSENLSMNLGGAVFVEENGSARLINCTLSGNLAVDGSGLYANQTGLLEIVNTIVAHGTGGGAAGGAGDVTVLCSNVFGNAGGDWIGPIAGLSGAQGNISVDPLFVDAASDDVHLRFDSPCRDAGLGGIGALPDEDFEGDPRDSGQGVDMGADEYYYHLYHEGTALPGGTIAIKVVAYPQAPVTLALGQTVLDPPTQTQYGELFIRPFLWTGLIGTAPQSGVTVVSMTIPSSWSSGDTAPMQALVGPWGGGWTMLTNLDVVRLE